MDGRRVIAVDFDGTLYDRGKCAEEPAERFEISTLPDMANQAVIRYVRAQHVLGHFIVVYTARPREDRARIEYWLDLMGVPFDIVQCGKLRYDMLIDDRTMRPEEVENAEHHQGRGAPYQTV